MGIIFKARRTSNRFIGFAASYDSKFAIGWGESSTLTWRSIVVNL